MEEKSESPSKLNKKRGRPKKIKQVEEEDKLISSSSCDDDYIVQETGPYRIASPPGPLSATVDTPMVSRRQTRYAKALIDKEAALNVPSRFSFQNDDDENPSVNSTFLLVKQILLDAKKVKTGSNIPAEVFASGSPVQAQDLPSQYESTHPDKIPVAWHGTTISSKIENRPTAFKNILELKKVTSDLPAQSRQSELHFEATPPCPDKIMVDNNKLPEMEANVDSNIFSHGPQHTANRNAQTSENPTRPSIRKVVVQVENPFVDVDGYKVKSEMVPLLNAIFAKYGDIAKHSTFSMESRSCLLELVCSIYKRLEASKLAQLTLSELQSMLRQIGDLELVKVEVGWLHHRLNQISKARQLFEGVSTFKDVEARTIVAIDERKKAVEMYKKELQTCMAAVNRLQEKLSQEKEELADVQSLVDQIKIFYEGKLVHGLI
ncbi:uncharacterized protein LOC105157572 [Sesamum indicum]|uniref:Uncharacterized protein LOC105157572 n=1 Tax=Sesamum indicum TaxID=4182 RepID=A0A6I9SQB6_SESIN|nr:uncharacterized protein LOC105157572 [Sesamum indicum]